MDNQHRKIVGYRELIPEEIDLMNRIKAAGKQLLDLQAELVGRLNTDYEIKFNAAKVSTEGQISLMGTPYGPFTGATDECIEFRRFHDAEPQRWAAIGKTDIQTGIMALVRAVAQPSV